MPASIPFQHNLRIQRSLIMSADWTIMLIFLIQSVPVVRLGCTDGALLRAQCSSVSIVRCELKIAFIIAIIIIIIYPDSPLYPR